MGFFFLDAFFLNFYFYFILLYNTVLVLPYIDMSPPRVYMCSQTWTPLPPLSPQYPSGSSSCTSPKHAVSCVRHRLAIRFLHDSIHVRMPFSQIIWVVVLTGLVGLHRSVQLQLLQHYWLGHRLGLLWYWMVCLGDEQRSFRRFWDCIQILHLGLFCWPWWLLRFFWEIPALSSRCNGHLS